jgi:hypothetical protein
VLESIGRAALIHCKPDGTCGSAVPPVGGFFVKDETGHLMPVTDTDWGTGPFAVKFHLAGNADLGVDYRDQPIQGVAEMDGEDWKIRMAPTDQKTIPIEALQEDLPEPDEGVVLQLLPGVATSQRTRKAFNQAGECIGSLQEATYVIGSPAQGTVIIEDDDPGSCSVTDAVGEECAAAHMGWVGLFVQSPSKSIEDQLAEGIIRPDTGHSFVRAFDPYQGLIGWGFYPQEGRESFEEKGLILDDTERPYNYYRVWWICPATFKRLKDAIASDRAKLGDGDPGNDLLYSVADVAFGNNLYTCTTWALETVKNLGIDVTLIRQPYYLARSPGFQPV